MRNLSGLIFVVLVLCGTMCILVSLAILALLFNSHALAMSEANKDYKDFPVYVLTFLFFVVAPALLAIFAGIWMAGTGIRIGQTASAGPPDRQQQ